MTDITKDTITRLRAAEARLTFRANQRDHLQPRTAPGAPYGLVVKRGRAKGITKDEIVVLVLALLAGILFGLGHVGLFNY